MKSHKQSLLLFCFRDAASYKICVSNICEYENRELNMKYYTPIILYQKLLSCNVCNLTNK